MPHIIATNPLQPLIDVFETILRFFHNNAGFSWGISIIVLTICVRLVLLPLTMKQMKSMQRMAKLQPELKALQARYKDDKQRLNQEVMKFYKENQVNPLASCLPLVAQFPVFISLYYMLRTDLRYDICPSLNVLNGVHRKGAVPHGFPVHGTVPAGSQFPLPCGLSQVHHEQVAAHFLGIPDITDKATGITLAVLLVLYVGSQLLSGILSTMSADRNQRLLMLALPFVFVAFIQRFPAGLLVYWITTNLWTVGQGIFVRRTVGPITPPKAAGGGDGGGGGLLGSLLGQKPSPPPGPATNGAGARPAAETAGRTSGGGRSGPPPPPPRRKKKRSGRRR